MFLLRLIGAVVRALFAKRADLGVENLGAFQWVQRLGGMLRFYRRAAA